MTEDAIITAIKQRITQNYYGVWTIGVTDDPARRKDELQAEGRDMALWQHWKADSEAEARRVEKHFLDKGCKPSPCSEVKSTYVYLC